MQKKTPDATEVFHRDDFDARGWSALLQKHGLKIKDVRLTGKASLTWDAPVHLVDVALSGHSRIGRYSYMRGGNFSGRMGAFCSLAQGIRIGDGNHPTTWLSSSPVQYRPTSFGFWPERARLEVSGKLPPDITKTAPEIGNDVWIGSDALILRGVSIGDGAVIAGGSIVTRDVAPYSIVSGVPARHRRFRFDPPLVERLRAARWWERDVDDLAGLSFDDPEACLRQLEGRAATRFTPLTCKLDAQRMQVLSGAL